MNSQCHPGFGEVSEPDRLGFLEVFAGQSAIKESPKAMYGFQLPIDSFIPDAKNEQTLIAFVR